MSIERPHSNLAHHVQPDRPKPSVPEPASSTMGPPGVRRSESPSLERDVKDLVRRRFTGIPPLTVSRQSSGIASRRDSGAGAQSPTISSVASADLNRHGRPQRMVVFDLFAKCISMYQRLYDAPGMPQEHVYFQIQLKLLQLRLLNWGKAAELSQRHGLSVRFSDAGGVNDMLIGQAALLKEVQSEKSKTHKAFVSSIKNFAGESPPPYSMVEIRFPEDELLDSAMKYVRETHRPENGLIWIAFDVAWSQRLLSKLATAIETLRNEQFDTSLQSTLRKLQSQSDLQIVQLNNDAKSLYSVAAAANSWTLPRLTVDYSDLDSLSRFKAFNMQMQQESKSIENLRILKDEVCPITSGLDYLSDDKRIGAKYKGQRVWIEWKSTRNSSGGRTADLREIIQSRVEQIASLLKYKNKPEEFRTPGFAGYFDDVEPESGESRFGFVFWFPIGASEDSKPIDLSGLLNTKDKPALSVRRRLASALARSLLYLHSTNWLHKSIRSHNVVFFPGKDSKVDFSLPLISGFDFARPDAPEELTEVPRENQEEDVYRHPRAQGRDEGRFIMEYDIYALGIVLLEIALWKPIWEIMELTSWPHSKQSELRRIRGRILENENLHSELKFLMDEPYEKAVLTCIAPGLNSDSPSLTSMDVTQLQLIFFSKVVQALEPDAFSAPALLTSSRVGSVERRRDMRIDDFPVGIADPPPSVPQTPGVQLIEEGLPTVPSSIGADDRIVRGWDSDVEDAAAPVPRRSTGSVSDAGENERRGDPPSPNIAPETVESVTTATPRDIQVAPRLPKASRNSVQRLSSGGYRVRWNCICGSSFQCVIEDDDRRTALQFYRNVHWDTDVSGPYVFRWPDWFLRLKLMLTPVYDSEDDLDSNPWLNPGISLTRSSTEPPAHNQGQGESTENLPPTHDLEAGRSSNGGHRQTQQRSAVDSDKEQQDSDYVCLCFRSLARWHLRQARTYSRPDTRTADRELFKSIREKAISRRRPAWLRRIGSPLVREICGRFTWYWMSWAYPVSIAGVAYHEFYLYDNISKTVQIGDKGKLPCDGSHDVSYHDDQGTSAIAIAIAQRPSKEEWSWTCHKQEGNIRRYLNESRLLNHYLLDPSCVPTGPTKGARYWRWIPRKLKQKLFCPDDENDKVGWGLVFEMEWNHTSFFLTCTLPVIVIALAITIPLSVKFKWPASTGFALFAAILALDVFCFTIVMARGKQRGLIK